MTTLKTKRITLIALAVAASIGGVASALAADSAAGAQPQSLLDDPSYRAYLRWNGFDVGDTKPAHAIPAPSYRDYLEWNGFTVSRPTTGPDIPAPSYATYQRWNGFDFSTTPPTSQARLTQPARATQPRS